jgi:hypothetical protein
MKTLKSQKIYLILIFFVLNLTSSIKAQNDTSVYPIIGKKLDDLTKINLDSFITSDITLNALFSKKISSYLSNSSDLTLSQAFAILDNSEGRLFLGGTYNKKPNYYTKHIFTAGIKADIADNISKLFDKDGLSKNLGLSFKWTMFFRGKMGFNLEMSNGSQKDKAQKERNALKLEQIYKWKEDSILYVKTHADGKEDTSINKFAKKFEKSMIKSYIDKEKEYLSDEKQYNVLRKSWLSTDIYIPISQSDFYTVKTPMTTSIDTQHIYPAELSVLYNVFWEKRHKFPFKLGNIFLNHLSLRGKSLLTFKASLVMSDSISSKKINKLDAETYLKGNTSVDNIFLSKLQSDKIYNGGYEKFWSFKVSARYVWMPYDNVGLSVAVEKYYFSLDYFNWKIGFPFSFKDSSGNTKVNFELMYSEVFKKNSISLNLALPLADNIF